MTTIDLTELRAKAEAATPGPWRVETDTTLVWGRCDPEDFTTYGMGIPLTEVRIGQQQRKGASLSYDEAEATAQFIAAANPSVVLALIDRVEKAEEEARRIYRVKLSDDRAFAEEVSRLRSLLARAGEALKPFAAVPERGRHGGPFVHMPAVYEDEMLAESGRFHSIGEASLATARTVAREIEGAIG